MRVPKTKVQDRLPALFASMIAAAASASPALADAAPIVYKSVSDSGRVAAERQTVFITPDQARPNADKARARVQFSYPGSNAPPQASQAVELTSGDSPHPVREYASISMPIPSSAAPVVAEVAAPKAFDPRAAAQEVAAQREPASVEVSPLAKLAETRTQEPKEQGMQNQPPLAEPRTITPDAVPVFDQTGAATVFSDEFQGLPTANGELFDQSELMAAHPSLPLPKPGSGREFGHECGSCGSGKRPRTVRGWSNASGIRACCDRTRNGRGRAFECSSPLSWPCSDSHAEATVGATRT